MLHQLPAFSSSITIMLGTHGAPRHAVEALANALRLELHSFHIDTAVIEPGPVETHFFKTLDRTSGELLASPNSCYSHFYEANVNYRKIQKRTPVNEAAVTIAKIIKKKKLKCRYKVAVPFMFRLIIHLPDSLKERMMRKH
nr:hypothetical protein [uncultured Caproiciproducens sp.]